MSAVNEYLRTQGLVQTIFLNAHQLNGVFNPAENEANIQLLGLLVRDMVSTARAQVNLIHQQIAIQPLNTVNPTVVPHTSPEPYNAPLRQARRYNPIEKSKAILPSKLEENCPEECAICQDQPKIKDAICTECNHWYCKTCWNDWMNSPTGNKKCPTCRKDMPKVTSFRARKVAVRVTDPASTRPTKKVRQPVAKRRPALIIEDDHAPSLFDELEAM